jgi:hemolysin type calcium-binding protein
MTRLRSATRRPLHRAAVVAVLSAAAVAGVATGAYASIAPGTPGNDVTLGADNDNAGNAFVQPPGVAAKQHMDNTDVLFGRGANDLLVGNLGSDTLVGGPGDDILAGGPENFTAPNSDVLLGDEGNDVNIWAPGDGSDAYVGDLGYDDMILAPFVKNANGSLRREYRNGRQVLRVDIDAKPQFACRIDPVPPTQNLGAQYLVRFFAGGNLAVTIRLKDVERVLCPSPWQGRVRVAALSSLHPTLFRDVPLSTITGTTGAIVAP